MLQPSVTTPGLSNSTGGARLPEYSGSSNVLAGENEYTWCSVLSLLGKVTRVPAWMPITPGTKVELRWSMTAVASTPARGAVAACRLTTAWPSGTAWPPSVPTSASRRSAAGAGVAAASRDSRASARTAMAISA